MCVYVYVSMYVSIACFKWLDGFEVWGVGFEVCDCVGGDRLQSSHINV